MLRPLNFAERRGLRNWVCESAGNPTIVRQLSLPSSIGSVAEAEQLIRRVAVATRALRSTLLWLPGGTPVIATGATPTVHFSSVPVDDEVDPVHRSATFHVSQPQDGSRIDVTMAISHLFADAGGADALVRRLEESEVLADRAPEPEPVDHLVGGVRSARNRIYWLDALADAGPPATPRCGVDRTLGRAAVVAVPLPDAVRSQVRDLAAVARVTVSTVWTTAVALTAHERCTGFGKVVCRLTCGNRYTVEDMGAVDYRAQPVFVPLLLRLDQSAVQGLRQVHHAGLLAHAHGWYDALDVLERLNQPSRGGWFVPTVELNVLQGTRGSQPLASSVVPHRFTPASAKADVVAGVDDRTVSLTVRGTGSLATAGALLQRMIEWTRLMSADVERPLADLVQHHELVEDTTARSLREAAVRSLITAALGRSDYHDEVEVRGSGRVVVHTARALGMDDAVELWRAQPLVPHSVVPDEWVVDGIAEEPRALAALGMGKLRG